MPVSKSLSKIQKGLTGGNKKHTVHPRGRKFHKLTRATLRENKIAAKKRAHNERRSNELARMQYIQDVINTETFKNQESFTHEETAVFIQQFISRDDQELEELNKKRRANRPPANKQLLLQQKRDLEMEEFRSGFLCPDLTDQENVIFLRNWNHTFGSLSTLKLIRINDKGRQVHGGSKPTNVGKDVEMQ